MEETNKNVDVFAQLPETVQRVLVELEELNSTYEVQMPATQSAKKIAAGVTHAVRLWSVPRETGELLYEAVRDAGSRRVLELGTSAGYSTIWLTLAVRQHGGAVVTVDSSPEKIALARKFAELAGVADSIEFVCMPIADYLNGLSRSAPHESELFDAVFFDADKKNYLRFYEMVLPYLAPQHLVLADDVMKYAPAMQNFLDRIQNDSRPSYNARVESVGHGLLIAETKSI